MSESPDWAFAKAEISRVLDMIYSDRCRMDEDKLTIISSLTRAQGYIDLARAEATPEQSNES